MGRTGRAPAPNGSQSRRGYLHRLLQRLDDLHHPDKLRLRYRPHPADQLAQN